MPPHAHNSEPTRHERAGTRQQRREEPQFQHPVELVGIVDEACHQFQIEWTMVLKEITERAGACMHQPGGVQKLDLIPLHRRREKSGKKSVADDERRKEQRSAEKPVKQLRLYGPEHLGFSLVA